MSDYVPEKAVQRGFLVTCFHLQKTAKQAHEELVKAYGDHALGRSQCFEWYKRFGDGDFDLDNKARGRPQKKVQDADLERLLEEDCMQTQTELAMKLNVSQFTISTRLRAIGKIRKLGKWVTSCPERKSEKNPIRQMHGAAKKLRKKKFPSSNHH
jgi:histone-lysine N-methyltransferase SETMAR